jgi:hypothetical protein
MTNETYPDPVVGILAVGALMAGLLRRHQTGEGALIDLSQREVTVALLGESLVDYSLTGRVASPTGNRHPLLAPQGVYPCQGDDLWVAICVGSDDEWRGLCRAIGQPDLVQDPRFETILARQANQTELDQLIAAWTKQGDHYRAMHILQAHGVPAGAVLQGSETLADPHLEARGFWDVVSHPEAGTYRQVSTPWRLSRDPRRLTLPAPGLGEHEQGRMGALDGQRVELVAGNVIVLPDKRDWRACEQPLDDGDRLRQPRHPGACRIEAQPCLGVFGLHVPGAQAELEPAIGQEVDRRGFTCHQHGVAQVVVEHIGANPEACRCLGSAN